ncbi:MAG: BamA/TamA family outer membrane protein [Parvicellaceae bacterium]
MNIVRITKYKFLENFIFSYLFIFIISSCSITKHVPEDEFLLRKVKIEFLNSNNSNTISKEELYDLLLQKPNRKVFSNFRFYLRLYNLSNQQRIDQKIVKKQIKIDKVNLKIKQQNRSSLILDSNYIQKPLKERKLAFGERIQNTGEAPVIYSALKLNRTKEQLKKYLFNKGYFKNEITDSTTVLDNGQIDIQYFIHLREPMYLSSIKYKCPEILISSYLDSIESNSFLKKGAIFDTDNLVKERNRINEFLTNSGFYNFNKEFIYFDIDTNYVSKTVDITLGIQNYKKIDKINNSFQDLTHKQFKISKVNIQIGDSSKFNNIAKLDSIENSFFKIVNYQPINFKSKVFKNSIFFKKDDYYKKSVAQQTYRSLISLGLFKYVNISFDTLTDNKLVGNIELTPSKTQNLSLSLDGTNNERLFGFQGGIDYFHNNLFHGGEKILISLKSSFEIQLLLTDSKETGISNKPNTTEFGPEFHFYLPKYLLINKIGNLRKHINPVTEFTGAFNIQDRPDYYRRNQELSFGWVFHENKTTTWHINPLLISIVDIEINSDFQNQIESYNDQYILSSFQDHVVAGGVFSFEYNGQNLSYNSNSLYFKTTFESAGGTLFNFHELINKDKNPLTDSYDFLGIRYAHFQKATLDLRYYQGLSDRSKIVYRIYSGVGIPKKNLSDALPFEKSFFAGGSNSLRAWRARSLGPGSYFEDSTRYDKIGDIKFEGNLEARFPISKWIEGAFFVDFGNIWLIGYDSLRPEGKFNWNNVLDDIAIGTGFGLRLNFEFFILRADLAIPFKNPGIPKDNNQWIFKSEKRDDHFSPLLNLGIGYPF